MNAVIILLTVLSSATAAEVALGEPKVVRVPQHDSAIIQSHRLGGNFAYSTHEAHAYQVETPIIKQKTVAKGVTYHHGDPIVKTVTSYVKQQVPQYGIVKTQHTVPAIQYAAVTPVQHQVVATQEVKVPVQHVQYSAAAGAPLNYYAAGGAPVQYYAAGGAPVQYYAAGGAPVQYYAAGGAPVHYVQYSGAPVGGQGFFPLQYAVSPVQS